MASSGIRGLRGEWLVEDDMVDSMADAGRLKSGKAFLGPLTFWRRANETPKSEVERDRI